MVGKRYRPSQLIFLFTLGISLSCINPSLAQFKTFAIPHNNQIPVKNTKRNNSTSRTQTLAPKKLPFWDDFSFTPVNVPNDSKSNYPVDSLWVQQQDTTVAVNRTVWINNGIGLNPPSINVATLDGLGANFLPYSNQVLANGLRDSLVSQPILLAEPNVLLAERNSVFLSFYFQWQGNGEPPDRTDYLLVEFRNDARQWESVMTIFPKSSTSRTLFYDTLVKVDGDRFFHNGFQFRFRTYGRQSGPYDTWNIDYVYLNKNRSVDDTDFPDQSISSSLTGLFNKYQSMPYDHFVSSGAIQSPKFDIFNVLNDFTDLTYLTEGTFYNYKDSIVTETFFSNLGVSDTSAINDDGSGIIFPLEKRTVTMQYVPTTSDATQFDPLSDSVFVKLKVRLFTGDTFNPKTGDLANDYSLNFLPIDFRVNDTINAQYKLKDYYAYDDGVAEYAAGLTQAGNRAALQFDMLTADPDTLVGIDVYAPDYGLISNLTTDFYVYDDLDGVPGNILYTLPSIVLQAHGLNKFQRIRIVEPFLVNTKFYLGWRAPVGGVLKIGLDFNNDAGDKILVNTNGTWTSNPGINGSLMIRPIFGKGNIVTGIPEEINMGIFPNPNQGEFTINDRFDKIYVMNGAGQQVPFQLLTATQGYTVKLHHPAAGLYIVKLVEGNKVRAGKVIVK